jgi:hypothetical protein
MATLQTEISGSGQRQAKRLTVKRNTRPAAFRAQLAKS